MNREERKEFALIVNGLIEENRKLMKQVLSDLHNTELRMRQDADRIESKLDAYGIQLYRHSFWGGIVYRKDVISEWLKRKILLRQKPKLKKLEIKQENA